MKQNLIVFLFLLIGPISFASNADESEFHYKSLIDWEETPLCTAIDSADSKEQSVILDYKIIQDQKFVEKYGGNLMEYYTIYKKIKVITDDGVESYNKLYVPMSGVFELIEVKARVITPKGEIIEVKEENIQESAGGDGLGPHKYMALDGVVKGSDVEYFYSVVKMPSIKGRKFTLQGSEKRKKMSYDLYCPSFLQYAYKSYNGFPEVVMDEVDPDEEAEEAHYHAMKENIEVAEDESFAAYEANLMCLVYKLDANTNSGKSNLVTFADFSQNVYKNTHGPLKGKDAKAVKKIIKAANIEDGDSEEEKIRKVEVFIKENIHLNEEVSFETIAEAFKNKYTSEFGMAVVFAQVMKQLDIQHEMVFTCNRFNDIFDPEFEHYQVLQELFLYFPSIKKYMDPTDFGNRLGYITSGCTNTQGLFIKEVGIGDIKTGSGKIQFIEGTRADETLNEMIIDVDFQSMIKPVVKFKHSMTGHNPYIQAYYNKLDDKTKKEIDEDYIMFADDKGEIISYTLSGVEKADIGVNPMVYEGSLETVSVMEKAGNKYLFNIGKLIGPQSELYSENERQFHIEQGNNRVYRRVITFTIPEGYELSGLEALNINAVFPDENPTTYFKSSYVQEGNKITVTVDEVYDQQSIDIKHYEAFRAVINAAANFNKVALFLVKK